MAEVKEERISKLAQIYGVGPGEIINYLRSKNSQAYGSLNPTSRVDAKAIELIQEEFAKDKKLHEQVQSLKKEKEKVERVASLTEAETRRPQQKEEEDVLDLDQINFLTQEVLAKPEDRTSSRKAVQASPSPRPGPVGPPEEKAPSEHPPAEETIIFEKPKLQHPKVVGSVDSETLEKHSRKPSRKKGEKPEMKEKESAGPPISEAAPGTQPEAEEAPPLPLQTPELFRGTVEKLPGLTVVDMVNIEEKTTKTKEPSSKAAEKKPAAQTLDKKGKEEKKKTRTRITRRTGFVKAEGESQSLTKPDDRLGMRRGDKPGVTAGDIGDNSKVVRDRLSQLEKKIPNLGLLRRKKKEKEKAREEEEKERRKEREKTLRVAEFVPANELAKLMDVDVTEVIKACFELGHTVSINMRLDAELITIIAEHFGFKVEFGEEDIFSELKAEEEADRPEDLKPRPPVVTVMGHVDHGKTSLLDYIRKTNVIAGEAGGITQHIGAYAVELEDGRQITFIDTPGHEAFTAMRARGAKVTDIAIIVIAADDSVMPQTVEAINHAQAAGVPMVFAFNKMDKPGANADKIREALANMNILVEEWGGKYQSQEISAKTGMGVHELLEKVLLEAGILDLKANPDKKASGTVIESSLDKGRGYLTTLLVQSGTLRVGDILLAGPHSGKVKALFNERGQRMEEAGPSIPARVLGLDGAPQAGDKFLVLEDEKQARELAAKKQQLLREQGLRARKHITLDEIGRRIAIGDFKQLNIIIKGDTAGSVEALAKSLLELSTEKIQVNILHQSVGPISESDVLLASASDAILIGFNVRPVPKAKALAEKEQIDVRNYSVIYKAIDEVRSAMEGMLAPEYEEKVTANVEVREVFNISKVGKVAGCYVLDGKVSRSDKIRVIRDGIVVHTGELSSLKRFKEDVREVSHGYECGIAIKNFQDIQVGDILEAFNEVAVSPRLA